MINTISAARPLDQATSPSAGGATETTREATPAEPTEQLWGIAREARSLAEFYANALGVLAARFDSPYAAISAQRKSATLQKAVAASESAKAWSSQAEELQLDARYRATPIARIVNLDSIGKTFAVLGTPISVEGEGVVGSVALVSPCVGRDGAEAKLCELKALTCLVGVLAAQVGTGPRQQPATEAKDSEEGLQQASRYRSASEFAYSITNGLKTKLDVAQATLGLVRNRRVEIVCISGFDRVEKHTPGVRAIQQALSECLDTQECLVSQPKTDRDTAEYLIHKAWRSRCAGDAVASIPILQNDRVVAVIGLQHRTGASFNAEHLARVQEKLTPLLAGLLLLRRSERPLGSHAVEAARDVWRGFRQSGKRRKVACAAVAAILAWSLVAKQTHVVRAPATLQASDIHQVAAPFEGTITECHVRPGTRLRRGEPIIEFDKTPILAERIQTESELKAAQATLRLAASARDMGVAATARADAASARSRLEVLDDKLRRTVLLAPADCVVLSGDITPRVGQSVPLGEPLVELATSEAKRVEVFVDESAATAIAVGQRVSFVTNARPSTPLDGVVTDVDATSTVHESKNTFRATIELDEAPPEWSIAGMEGIARVDAGKQPVWWVWCHGAIDAVRLQWWKL